MPVVHEDIPEKGDEVREVLARLFGPLLGVLEGLEIVPFCTSG